MSKTRDELYKPHIDTGGGLISKDNIDLVAPLAEQGIR